MVPSLLAGEVASAEGVATRSRHPTSPGAVPVGASFSNPEVMSDAMVGLGLRMSPRHPKFPSKTEDLEESPLSRAAGSIERMKKGIEKESVGGRTRIHNTMQRDTEAAPLEIESDEEEMEGADSEESAATTIPGSKTAKRLTPPVPTTPHSTIPKSSTEKATKTLATVKASAKSSKSSKSSKRSVSSQAGKVKKAEKIAEFVETSSSSDSSVEFEDESAEEEQETASHASS